MRTGKEFLLIFENQVLFRFESVDYSSDRGTLLSYFSKEGLAYPTAQDPVLEQLQKWWYGKETTARTLNKEEAAEGLKVQYHILTMEDSDEVYFYDEERGVYRLGGEVKVKAWLEANSYGCDTRIVNETTDKLKRQTYVRRETFDADKSTLNLSNCLFNVRTGEHFAHSPEYRSITQLPVRYFPGADCPRIKQFLSEVLNVEDVQLVQEWFGYFLWRDYPIQKALLLVGDGANGKSTLINLIKAFLGTANVSARGLQELERDRFAKASLFGKMANLHADLPDTALKSTGTFKMLTGGDLITSEYKFRNSFEFANYAKLVFSANVVPEVTEDTLAYFRRWDIVNFPNTFTGDKANPKLLESLTTEEELSGLLNWALEGLRRLQNNGWTFTNSKGVDEVKEEYIRKSAPGRAFLMDCVLIGSAGEVIKQELYQAFCQYCRLRNLPIMTSDTFFKKIPQYVTVSEARKACEYIEGHDRCGKSRHMVFQGLKLLSQADWAKPGENKIGKTPDRPDTPDGNPVNPVKGLDHFNRNGGTANEQ